MTGRAPSPPFRTVDVARPERGGQAADVLEGFNPDIKLRRTEIIKQGASHYDFRFKLKKPVAG